jgi:DNA-binding PadR family transcriptional regulator
MRDRSWMNDDDVGDGLPRSGARRGGGRGPRGGGRVGPGPWVGHGRHGGPAGWPRMRRGQVRAAILAVVLEEPRHGYDVIQALEARSGGAWRPSAGSVYPTLQQLEDEGLATSEERDGKRVYSLTEAGRQAAQESADSGDGEPFASTERRGLRAEVMQLHAAARQVGAAGDTEQIDKAVAIVSEARRALYRLLADG